jgi:hypothetical protein
MIPSPGAVLVATDANWGGLVAGSERSRVNRVTKMICEAEIELAGDRKQEMILDAAAALVHAFRHERDLARNRMASACEGRAEVTDDRSTQQAAWRARFT